MSPCFYLTNEDCKFHLVKEELVRDDNNNKTPDDNNNKNPGFLTLTLLSFLYHNTGAIVQFCSMGDQVSLRNKNGYF